MAGILFFSPRKLDEAPFEREDKKKRLTLLLKQITENQLKELETNPDKIEKPWGYEELWAQANRYVGKILFIRKGHRLSRQYHRIKSSKSGKIIDVISVS